MIIDQGEAEVNNHILKGDIFSNALQEWNIYFIIPNFYTWFLFYIKLNR